MASQYWRRLACAMALIVAALSAAGQKRLVLSSAESGDVLIDTVTGRFVTANGIAIENQSGEVAGKIDVIGRMGLSREAFDTRVVSYSQSQVIERGLSGPTNILGKFPDDGMPALTVPGPNWSAKEVDGFGSRSTDLFAGSALMKSFGSSGLTCMAVNPANEVIYVAQADDDKVVIVDTKAIHFFEVDVEFKPQTIVVNPMTGHAFIGGWESIGDENKRFVTVLDENHNVIAKKIPVPGFRMMTFDPTGGGVVHIVNSASDLITIRDAFNFPQTKTATGFNLGTFWNVQVVADPHQGRVYVGRTGQFFTQVMLIDPVQQAIQIVSLPHGRLGSMMVDEATQRLYVSVGMPGKWEVMSVDTALYAQTQMRSDGARLPVAVAVDPIRRVVFSANAGSHDVTEYIMVANAGFSIPVVRDASDEPRLIANDPIGQRTYVAIDDLKGRSYLATIDYDLGINVDQADLPSRAKDLLADPQHERAIVLMDDHLSWVWLKDPKSTEDLPLANARAMALDDALGRLYVIDNLALHVVDLPTRRIIHTIRIDEPLDVAVDVETHDVYVAAEKQLRIFTPSQNYHESSVEAPWAVGLLEMKVNPQTHRIYAFVPATLSAWVVMPQKNDFRQLDYRALESKVLVDRTTNRIYFYSRHTAIVVDGATDEVKFFDPFAIDAAADPHTGTLFLAQAGASDLTRVDLRDDGWAPHPTVTGPKFEDNRTDGTAAQCVDFAVYSDHTPQLPIKELWWQPESRAGEWIGRQLFKEDERRRFGNFCGGEAPGLRTSFFMATDGLRRTRWTSDGETEDPSPASHIGNITAVTYLATCGNNQSLQPVADPPVPNSAQPCIGGKLEIPLLLNAKDVHIEWMKDGKLLQMSSRYFDGVNGPLFSIVPVEPGDTGQYQARITNGCETHVTQPVAVTVQESTLTTPSEERVSWHGAHRFAFVTNNCPTWTAVSNVPWIKLDKPNGSTNSGIGYDVQSNTSTVLRTGKITISGTITITVLQGGRPAKKADFNGDLRGDLFLRHTGTGSNSMILDQNASVIIDPQPVNWWMYGSGHFDDDGMADVVFYDGAGVELWMMNGSKKKSTVTLVPPVPNALPRVIGDLTGDGIDDLLFVQPDNTVVVRPFGFPNANAVLAPPNGVWFLAGVADVDRDGWGDLLYSANDGTVLIEKRLYDALQGTQTLLPQPGRLAGSGDFDADSAADLLMRDPQTGATEIWFMGGAQPIVKQLSDPMTTDWLIAGTTDVDGDFKTDIIWRNLADGRIAIWFMDAEKRKSEKILNASTSLTLTAPTPF